MLRKLLTRLAGTSQTICYKKRTTLRWIKACITNVQYSILINGKPRERIKAQRGIRQGDPISPFIFVLAMDYLSRLLLHLKKRNAIKGALLNNICSICHLLFADDILIFVEDDDVYIKNLQNALSLFKLASGLKINLSKSIISPVNVSVERAARVANLFGFTHQFFT